VTSLSQVRRANVFRRTRRKKKKKKGGKGGGKREKNHHMNVNFHLFLLTNGKKRKKNQRARGKEGCAAALPFCYINGG